MSAHKEEVDCTVQHHSLHQNESEVEFGKKKESRQSNYSGFLNVASLRHATRMLLELFMADIVASVRGERAVMVMVEL